MKTVISYLATLILNLLPFLAHAGQEIEAPKQKVSVSTSSRILSAYVFDGTLVYDNPVWQSDLTIEFPHGLYLYVWRSSDMDRNPSSSFGDELDYTLG